MLGNRHNIDAQRVYNWNARTIPRQLKDAMNEVPEGRGAYVLIVSVKQTQRLAIGRLGKFTFVPGFYAYVGSACGHGGIRARVSHHLAPIAEPHWHIDYLLGVATPIEVWYALSDRKLEQEWVETLRRSLRFQVRIPRFGTSDYRRSRTTHLFYSKQRPSFRWFEAKVKEVFEPSIRAQQFALKQALAPYPSRARAVSVHPPIFTTAI